MTEQTKKTENSSDVTKFTDEEMNTLKQIQATYLEVQNALGQSAVQKLRLAQQIESLNNFEDELSEKFINNQKTEQEFLSKITEIYGAGTLDPETGIYNKN